MTTDESGLADAPRRVTVTRGRHGWEVMEERDNRVVRRALFTDWHRVERAIGLHAPTSDGTMPAVIRPSDDESH